MICTYCGVQNKRRARRCAICGRPLTATHWDMKFLSCFEENPRSGSSGSGPITSEAALGSAYSAALDERLAPERGRFPTAGAVTQRDIDTGERQKGPSSACAGGHREAGIHPSRAPGASPEAAFPSCSFAPTPQNPKPLSAWAYLGYRLLFSIPLVGLILLIVFSCSSTCNRNLRSFARSYWCGLLLALCLLVLGIAVLWLLVYFSILPEIPMPL